MWKLIGKPVTQQLTRKLATEFVHLERVSRDRPLSERRMACYARFVATGQFGPMTWAKAYVKETGQWYRVNGKHTSTLFSTLDPLPSLFVTVQAYECDSLDDLSHLYATFDSRMQTRTANDITMSFAGTLTELNGLASRTIHHAVAGMSYYYWGDDAHRDHSPQERAELLLEHSDFVLWMATILIGKDSCHMDRGPVIAAMMGSEKKSRAKATEFWTAVRDQTGARPDMPDRKLAKFLTHALLSQKKKPIINAKHSGRHEMYVKCIHAWNAWREGVETDLKYYIGKKAPAFR